MDAAGVVIAAGLMGLAGTPHCAAMCAAPCAAVTRGCGSSAQPLFQAGRLLGYALAGAVAASSVFAIQHWLGAIPVLRPFWVLLHLAAFALGLWMVIKGSMPALEWSRGSPAMPAGWQKIQGPARSALAGTAWIAWPCALSQSALLVASLADRPWIGAAAMASFAIASSPGLLLGPWLLRRLAGPAGGSAAAGALAVRAGGLMLAGASAWALGHGLWERVAAWCAT